MQGLRYAAKTRVFEAAHENAERLIQCHSRCEQMRELLRKKVKMRVAESLTGTRHGRLGAVCPRTGRGGTGGACRASRCLGKHRRDFDRRPAFFFDLMNRGRPIIRLDQSLDEFARSIARGVSELGHAPKDSHR